MQSSKTFKTFFVVVADFRVTVGFGTPFFSVRYVTFFSVLKKEHSVLFSIVWRLMKPKRTFRSFPFFSKERKRTQRMLRYF